VYPKQQARRLAERARQNVLTTRNETTTAPARETTEDNLVRISPSGSEAPVNDSQQAEGTPGGRAQSGQRADDDAAATSRSTPASAGTVARARTQLPQTASTTPLVAMIGLLLLAAAAIMHLRRSYPA
jgi:LPXTG-motif cell wall-anchored protein